MNVSVIIPVYNAASYIMNAVSSVIELEEVSEVLLIEDGSTDHSLAICKCLSNKESKIKLFQHNDKLNHGVAASRNIGLKNAIAPYIAFLDADDIFLKNRFYKTKEIFKRYPEADGVYEAIERYFIKNKLENPDLSNQELITIKGQISPEKLFEEFFLCKTGWFSINGLVIKKQIIEVVGYFDEQLRQAEDTDYILRICLNGKLFPGELNKPVARAITHGENQTLDEESVRNNRYLLFLKWFNKILECNWSKPINRHIIKGLLYNHPMIRPYEKSRLIRYALKGVISLYLIFRYPKLLQKLFF